MPDSTIALPSSFLRRTNLWLRLAAASTLGFLVLFVALGLLVLRVVDDSRDRILEERLVIAQLVARQVDGVLEHDFTELERVSASADLRAESSPDGMSDVFSRILSDSGENWLDFYVLDADGRLLAAAPLSQRTAGGDPAVRVIAASSVTDGISAPYVDEASGKPAAALVVPFAHDGSSLVLAGVIDLSLQNVAGALDEARSLGKTGHAELFDSEGRVIASTDAAYFLAPGEHRDFYLRTLASGSEEVATVHLQPRNEEEAHQEASQHIMAVGLLSSAPWGVAIGGSKAETLAPVTDLRNSMLLLGVASLVTLWIAALFIARLLVRPVHVLTGAADRIAAGDLQTPIRVAEGGEIGRLGETLEQMRAKLQASLEEIAERDRELERRVEARTQEVRALLEELRRKEAMRGRLLESVISAQEDERKRIARELHDDTGQALTGIILSLEAARDAIERDAGTARERLEKAISLAAQSIEGIRQLVADLRPAALDDLGLVPALRALAETHLGEKGIRLEMEATGLRQRLTPAIETCLFRVVQEAITNIIRHSQAESAEVRLARANGVVSLLVADDGKGFDPEAVMTADGRARALGLAGMHERMSLIGGRLVIHSAPGAGTRLSATIPLESEAS